MFIGKKEVKDIFFATGSNKKRVKEIYIGTQRVYNSNYSRGLSYEYDSKTQTYTVVGRGTCNDSHIIIPSFVNVEYGYKKVIAIKEQAFYENTSIIALTLGDNIETIGKKAFMWCGNLKEINFGRSLIKIEGNAFEHCPALNPILTLPSGLQHIGSWAFADANFSKIFVPNSVNYMEYYIAGNSRNSDLKFYCEAKSQPSGWTSGNPGWRAKNQDAFYTKQYGVEWEITKEEFNEIIKGDL